MNIEAKQKRILKRLDLKEFRVVSTETITKEVYVLAKDSEHAEQIACESMVEDLDWEILIARPEEIEAEEVIV